MLMHLNNNLEQQIQLLFSKSFLSYDNVPIGWKWMTLEDVTYMSAGGDKPQNISEQKTQEYKYPVYSNGTSNEGLYGFTNNYKISKESVTVSARGTIGYVCLRHTPYTPIVRLLTILPRTNIITAKYLYLWLKSIPIHGTGTTQQQLTVPDFRKTRIIVPTKSEISVFTENINPIFQHIWANQEETEKLQVIRNTLLARLLSNELDISHIAL